jgi:large subunit ribosomal protein L21
MYAIISDRSRQHTVRTGDRILIDFDRDLEEGAEIVFAQVCLIGGDAPKLGAPLVDGASVVGEVRGVKLGPKITIGKLKKRKNYRRKTGFRARYNEVLIKEIRA